MWAGVRPRLAANSISRSEFNAIPFFYQPHVTNPNSKSLLSLSSETQLLIGVIRSNQPNYISFCMYTQSAKRTLNWNIPFALIILLWFSFLCNFFFSFSGNECLNYALHFISIWKYSSVWQAGSVIKSTSDSLMKWGSGWNKFKASTLHLIE